jgi:hypothetical protein
MREIAKAIAAGLSSFVATLIAATDDGFVTNYEWTAIIAGAAAVGLTVWAVPNAGGE